MRSAHLARAHDQAAQHLHTVPQQPVQIRRFDLQPEIGRVGEPAVRHFSPTLPCIRYILTGTACPMFCLVRPMYRMVEPEAARRRALCDEIEASVDAVRCALQLLARCAASEQERCMVAVLKQQLRVLELVVAQIER